MVFLPECFDYIGRSRDETLKLAMHDSHDLISSYRQLAREHDLWLSLGGFHHRTMDTTRKPLNTHLIIDNRGETRAAYSKLHLFDVDIPGRVRLMESEFSSAGDEVGQGRLHADVPAADASR
jgi:predicted amidohydrolase